MKPIIRVENLSKKYIIGHDKGANGSFKYKSLRESIMHSVRGVGQRILHPLSPNKETTELEEFWALNDINFEIEQGDKVGIIGRNGAGKSTLLKILSRITEPTTGKITMKGRVSSLLEVGTGFHPELTGRENIYLNGTILGMRHKEIRKKFDEIVDFSGVEKFLDTPVKKYSSGMYVRLAFAVAAHLDPEILLVDEVLAVGDAEFQKKCLGKMDEVSQQGRTILFVSHNMEIIRNLCDKCMLLNNGYIKRYGKTSETISEYLFCTKKESSFTADEKIKANKTLRIIKAYLHNGDSIASSDFENNKKLILSIIVEVLKEGKGYNIGFDISSMEYGCIFCSTLDDCNIAKYATRYWEKGKYVMNIEIPISLMRGGDYSITIGANIPKTMWLDKIEDAIFFTVIDKITPIAIASEPRNGIITPIIPWTLASY